MTDKVSIITPAYNAARYIARTIRSVLAQTYENWELLLIEDCSTDDTRAVIEPFLADPRIRLLQNPVNSGAAVSRNYGLREATGRYIAFLDGDDLWHPEKLARQVAFMQKTGYRFTFTDYRICLNGKWSGDIITGPNAVGKWQMYNYCWFSTITVMYEREAIGLIQIADLKKNNDYAMWLQAIEKARAYRLPECLSYYIKHDDSISGGSKLKLIRHHYILFRTGLGKPKPVALLLTVNNLFWGVLKKLFYRKKCEMTEEIPL